MGEEVTFKGSGYTILVGAKAFYVGPLPGRKRLVLALETATGHEALAYFSNDEAAKKFINLFRYGDQNA